MADEKYIVQSLRDGLVVLKRFMELNRPAQTYVISDLAAMMPEFDYQRILRTMHTAATCGFIEIIDGKRFRLGMDLLMLSHNHILKLKAEHDCIKAEIAKFKTEL